MHIGHPTELTPAALDLDRTLTLVEPLYQDRLLATGEPFLAHARGTARILAPLRGDADLLCAACLFGVHDVLREPDEWLRVRFGAGVAQLVADLRQLMKLSELTRKHGEAETKKHGNDDQAAAFRRMLLAMANDLRVVLLRLASRRPRLPNIVEVLMRSAEIASVRDSRTSGSPADLYLHVPLEGYTMSDFDAIDEIVEAGYQYTMRRLEAWDGVRAWKTT